MLSVQQVSDALNAAGVNANIQFTDSSFGVPSKEYLLGDFSKWFASNLREDKLETWKLGNDCDNFAIRFYDRAQWAHFATNKSTAEGLAVGVMFFMSGARAEDGTGGGHAVNVAIVGDEDNREVIFIEPQLSEGGLPSELKLTEYEKESVWFLLF